MLSLTFLVVVNTLRPSWPPLLLAAAKSEEAALKIAQAGIDAMYKTFDFIAADGSSLKFDEALKKVNDSSQIRLRR